MKTQTFGIEIEMNHITRQRAAQVVAETLGERATFRHTGGAYDAWEVTAPDGRRWKLVSDASIAGPRDQGTEFVSPICRWEDIETVQACVRALRAAGAHADPSCGIHVHVGLGEHLRLSYQVQHRAKKGKTLRALCVRMKLPHTN